MPSAMNESEVKYALRLPDWLYYRIKDQAANERRSANSLIVTLLIHATGGEPRNTGKISDVAGDEEQK